MRPMQRHQTNAWMRLGIVIAMAAGLVLSTSQAAFAGGDVTVALQPPPKANQIKITGDGSDNEIKIESDGSALTVTGMNSTTVNGLTDDTISTVGKVAVVVAMGSGSDYIYFEADDNLFWNIFMQNGEDFFVTGGIGCDVKKFHLQLENDNDTAFIYCSSDTTLQIDGGSGNDDLGIDFLDGNITIKRVESIFPFFLY